MRGADILTGAFNFSERNLERNRSTTGSPRIAFIVGVPRSGSTALFQYLTAGWDFGYMTNDLCQWNHSLLTRALASRIDRAEGHASFRSQFGNTVGPNAPSECGEWWNRWFDPARHYVPKGGLPPEKVLRLRAVLTAWTGIEERPILFKNMVLGQRIGALSDVLPEALFIVIRRDPLKTAASILETRRIALGDERQWWSVRPKEFEALRTLPPVAQVAGQVYWIERQIREDLERYYPDRQIQVRYEDWLAQPVASCENIVRFMAGRGIVVRRLENALPAPLMESRSKHADDPGLADAVRAYAERV